jgi:hypothetical protein
LPTPPIFRCVSRRTAALVSIAAAAFLTGCAPGANDELRNLVDGLAPAERDTLECEWESQFGSGDVKSYYGCSWFVPGGIAQVGRAIVSRANTKGFTVYCDGEGETLRITGTREMKSVSITVLADGFAQSETISPEDVDIPPGHVLVAIAALETKSRPPGAGSGPRCVP